MYRVSGSFARSVALLGLGVAFAYGQTTQISGQISDESKAAITGAKLILKRSDTGDRRETISNGEGYYSFPLLLPGAYELSAEKESFEGVNRTGIVVQTGQNTAIDLTLRIGAVSQAITVEEQLPLLQTDSAAIANVVENKTIINMPLLDRRSSQLQRLSGFVVQSGSGSNSTFAIAGGRSNNANYLIDGGSAQNILMGVPILIFDPPVESVQEFNVALSNYAAELGRSGGGVIQMTTKSGTNNFHGSAYEFFRNDALNARTFFSKKNPALRYNLFGASVSGPIIKNKTQFFFNYEGRRQVTSPTLVLSVPSQAQIHGNFAADSFKVIDPATGAQFEDGGVLNVIPQNRLDPVGAKLAALFPAPNVAGAPAGKANFIANDPTNNPVDVYVARIDHSINDNNRIFGRLLAQTDHTQVASVFPVAGTDPFGSLQHDYYYDISTTFTHNFTPTTINELRYGYVQRQYLYYAAGANTNIDSQIGLTGINQAFFPSVVINGYTGLGTTYIQERRQTPVVNNQIVDDLTLVRGSHQIKFGFEFRHSSSEDQYYPAAGGLFAFNNLVTGNSLASLLLARVYSGTVLSSEPLHTRVTSLAGFVQDDWHVTSRLTLNLGLRYDVDEPRSEVNNRQNGFDPTAINPVPGTPGAITFAGRNGVGRFANRWDLNNFGPRVGFAWKASDSWVIRGGGALLYLPEYDQATPIVANTGFSAQGTFVSPNNGATPAFYLAGGVPVVSAPAPGQLNAGFGAVTVGQRPTTAISFFDPNRKTGYIYQASLDIQRQFKGNIVVDAGYLGSYGHRLPSPDAQSINQVPENLLGPGNAQDNRPFPQYSDVQIIAPDVGISKYNGVNVSVQKRYSNGLTLNANYTYSKLFDNLDARNELANYPGEVANPASNTFTDYYHRRNDYGLSGNDIRHRFIFSSVYELPVGSGRAYAPGNRIVSTVAGGWSLGVIAELRSGTPLSPIELTNNTNSFSQAVRPNVVGDPAIAGGRSESQKLLEWFNVNAFAAPAPYTFGNAGRTFGEGPGAVNVDASLLKDFRVAESFVLQFRAEGLNVLNHPTFANPDTRRGSPAFGQITSLVAGNQSRILQLGLHLQF